MAEENQVEQTTETKEEEPQVQDTPSGVTFTEDEMNEIVRKRLAKEMDIMYKNLCVDDLYVAINVVKIQK